MLSPNAICTQINGLLGHLISVGLAVDQNSAFTRRDRGKSVEVTFPGAGHLSVSLRNRSYDDIYRSLRAERAYIARMPDGALLLMRYVFQRNELRRHSLGFYPSPDLEEFQNNPEIYLEDLLYAEVVSRNIVPFPIRFDFDCRKDVFVPVKHPKSHLTLGQYERCRIPVTSPLTPFWFVSFVLRNFYNTAFMEYASTLQFSKEVFEESIVREERELVHVHIPIGR